MNAFDGVPGCAISSITCIKIITVAKPEILCQLYYHAKQYDNDDVCHNNRTVEVAWQYISEWL